MPKRFTPLILIICVLGLAALACNYPINSTPLIPGASVQEVAYRLVTVDPNAPPTPTPFQPIAVTPTYLPTDMPPTATPLPTATPVPQANPASEIEMPKNQVNILLEGSDYRSGTGFRTDVMILAMINPAKGTVTLVSFPRDLYVYIYGWQNNRLNTAQQFGFSTTQATFSHNFGVRVDHYILTNFDGFRSAIRTLGDITVEAAQNLTDRCDLPIAVNGNCSVGPGPVDMGPDMALWYVRSRHTSSDIDRLRRTQEVMLAVFKKLMSANAIAKAPELYKQYQGTIETDMKFQDMLSLLPMAAKIGDAKNVRRFAIGYGQVYNYTTPEGAMVLMPNMGAIQALLREAMNP
jgi:LCP family protein required for cell wall assembly